MANEEDFRRAVTNPDFRQSFIDLIGLGDLEKYVRSIKYHSTGEEGMLMETVPGPCERKSEIIVFSRAFETKRHQNLTDFLGTLFNHEGYHARSIFEEGDKSSRWLAHFYEEFCACSNELKNLPSGASQEYVADVEKYLDYYKMFGELIHNLHLLKIS